MRLRSFLPRCQCGFAMRLENLEATVDFFPVCQVPPSRQIFGTAIVVFEVIGVFPNVVTENGEESLGDWIVLVGRAHDLNTAIGFTSQPDPSAAELLGAGV